MWWSATIGLGHIIFTGQRLSLPVKADQILMRSGLGIRLRLIGLKVKPELKVIGQKLLWWLLVRIQQEVLMMAARKSPYICVYPTSGIFLLDKVSLGLWETIF